MSRAQLSNFNSGANNFQGRSYLSKRQSYTQGNISDLNLIECEIKGFEWLLKGNQIRFYCVAVQMVLVMGCGRTKGNWIRYQDATLAISDQRSLRWHTDITKINPIIFLIKSLIITSLCLHLIDLFDRNNSSKNTIRMFCP